MTTYYTKEQVLALVREELESVNKSMRIPTVIGGLTDTDIQTIGIISIALREREETINTNQIALPL